MDGEPHPSEALEFLTVAGSGPAPPPSPPAEKTFPSAEHQEDIAKRIPSLDGGNEHDGSPKPIIGAHARNLTSLDAMFAELSQTVTGYDAMVSDSEAARAAEHAMSLRDGLRLYPKAIAWSALLSLTLVMEGYDLAIVNGFFALPQFRRRYGKLTASSGYQISTKWQSALTNGAVSGEIIGLFANGIVTEAIGYRRTLIIALAFLCCSIFFAFFASHIWLLLISEILCGLSWGVFQTLSTTYAAEVMPVTLRAYLTSTVNLCWLLGQLVALGVLRGTLSWPSQWSYRLPFGLQWVWAVPLLVAVSFAPESPWFLVRKHRYDEARKSLARLTKSGRGYKADHTIAMMKHTDEVEKYLSPSRSYWDCFKGVDLRRTEIVCFVWMIQTLSGGPMTGYATYFFTSAGINDTLSFDLSFAMYGIAIFADILSFGLIRYFGRRTLYISGCCLMATTLLIGGIIGTQPQTQGMSWALGGLVVLTTFFYDCTVGPLCYALVSELASTRLRVKSITLARVAYNVVGIVSNILMPKMVNPSAWNLKGKTCFVWAGTALASALWCYFRLPEPKGLTYLEIDLLFQRKASARKFREVQVHLERAGYFEMRDETEAEERWAGQYF